ncbi:hypothetical protein PR048_017217 [Dryococelus australis]|uniref:C2H2-type domain-containing protein n=1 Tax=Dryococelus australis TaxID=614101 RepID=A0ABQ9H8Y6_9NEOP|nr:hypothetical protein PR048_017217 [Dryococelus australis]
MQLGVSLVTFRLNITSGECIIQVGEMIPTMHMMVPLRPTRDGTKLIDKSMRFNMLPDMKVPHKKALAAYKNGNMGFNECCRQYGNPKPKLKCHLDCKNVIANAGMKALGRTLPLEIENQVVEHILKLEELLFGVTINNIRKLAYQIAEHSHIPHCIVVYWRYWSPLLPPIFRASLYDLANARPHGANIVRLFLDDHQASLSPRPTRFPDLSPIENVFSMVRRRLACQRTPAVTTDELRARIEAAWAEIPETYIQSLLLSMPRRLATVIAALSENVHVDGTDNSLSISDRSCRYCGKTYSKSCHARRHEMSSECMKKTQWPYLTISYHKCGHKFMCHGVKHVSDNVRLETYDPQRKQCFDSYNKHAKQCKTRVREPVHVLGKPNANGFLLNQSGFRGMLKDHIAPNLTVSLKDVCSFLAVDLCGLHPLQAGVEPVDKEMARGAELSDFDKGVIVGCHLSRLSSRALAQNVNRPKSTVALVWRKWKDDGHCANAARSEPTDLDIPEEELSISPISRQAIQLGDSGGVWTGATGHWSSGNWFCGVMSQGLHYAGPMDVYGCGVYPGNGFCRGV